MSSRSVRTVSQSQLEMELALKMARVAQLAWPDDPEGIAEFFLKCADPPDTPAPQQRKYHVMERDGLVMAMAVSFARAILTPAGPMTILALASVCSDPACRNQGLGRAVVQPAFRRVDRGDFRLSLFQTGQSAKGFYEKLGARAVDNLIVNSLKDPQARAFWDPVAMIYPTSANWPEGTIDLLGPGY